MTGDGVTWTFIACLGIGIVMLLPTWMLLFMAGMSTDTRQRWTCLVLGLGVFAGAVAIVMAGGGWL